MLANQIDVERTKAARKAKIFVDRRSKFTLAGHIYLMGEDRSRQRHKVFEESHHSGNKCALCGDYLGIAGGDYEHIKGGRKFERCDCLRQVLADGTVCTN